MSANIKQMVQTFGRALSGMVMPNIGAFIAWGIITALFIPTGWMPNESLGTLVDPMVKYLLPLLIGYTGGKNVYGVRGGVLGAIATTGVIVGTDIPMFIGAMIMGPVGGIIIKKFDKSVENKIPAGFEMLINNFSLGILGALVSIAGFTVIGPVVSNLSNGLGIAVAQVVNMGLLPLISIFIEPAKILFLNNAINHGVLTPLGLQETQAVGKSIFYLLEANPGPGLGVLLAYSLFAKGNIKDSAPSAAIIHFFGGIHEIYFPYVLMNPLLLLAVIAGGASGVFTFVITGASLTAASSPGSILSIMAMAPKGGHLSVLAGVFVATAVSFVVASFFVKRSAAKMTDDDLEASKNKVQDMKAQSKNQAVQSSQAIDIKPGSIKMIIYACDAGMGSSAMGAGMLGKRLAKSGYNFPVKNFAISDIPKDATVVVTHEQLTNRAKTVVPNAYHISVKDFLDMSIAEHIMSLLDKSAGGGSAKGISEAAATVAAPASEPNVEILNKQNILQNQKAKTKEEAITAAGNHLVKRGYVEAGYVEAMLQRERDITTYIGKGVAIPHGVSSAKHLIKKSGIVILQYPDGVDFDDEKAYLIIGIAGIGNDHLQILSKLSDIIDSDEEDKTKEIAASRDLEYVYNLFK